MVQDLLADEEFDLTASGTKGAAPAPLPDVVAFAASGSVTLVPVDPLKVTVRATGPGTYTVDVTCDGLPPQQLTGTVTAVSADALVITPSPVRKQVP